MDCNYGVSTAYVQECKLMMESTRCTNLSCMKWWCPNSALGLLPSSIHNGEHNKDSTFLNFYKFLVASLKDGETELKAAIGEAFRNASKRWSNWLSWVETYA